LRPYQFCNLSEIIVRGKDTVKDLEKKVRLATIIGTFQSTLTHFPYLRKIWHTNTAEERLLGVSMTGIMDNAITNGKDAKTSLDKVLTKLRQVAVDTNKEFADSLGIPQSTAITCVKPSGTVSQLTDSASGIHARHSQYYIRTVRGDKKDPLTQFMMDQNIPWETDGWSQSNAVFSFPIKAPDMCVTRDDMSAIEQLEFWKIYAMHWCEHKPSVTISVGKDEWLETGAWIYKNFNIDEAHYKEFLTKMPEFIDWTKLAEYEQEDNTIGNQTLACTADACEIVDIVN
jgi:ribonucleoside-diphosphate reductase alpha chain